MLAIIGVLGVYLFELLNLMILSPFISFSLCRPAVFPHCIGWQPVQSGERAHVDGIAEFRGVPIIPCILLFMKSMH